MSIRQLLFETSSSSSIHVYVFCVMFLCHLISSLFISEFRIWFSGQQVRSGDHCSLNHGGDSNSGCGGTKGAHHTNPTGRFRRIGSLPGLARYRMQMPASLWFESPGKSDPVRASIFQIVVSWFNTTKNLESILNAWATKYANMLVSNFECLCDYIIIQSRNGRLQCACVRQ